MSKTAEKDAESPAKSSTRGRKKTASAEEIEAPEQSELELESDEQQTTAAEEPAKPAPKRRGRPPKNKAPEETTEGAVTGEDDAPAKTRRKSVSDVEEEDGAGNPSSQTEDEQESDAGTEEDDDAPETDPAEVRHQAEEKEEDPENENENGEDSEQPKRDAKPVPKLLRINDLIFDKHDAVLKRLDEIGVRVNPNRSKLQLLGEYARRCLLGEGVVEVTGVFDSQHDGNGTLKFEELNFLTTALDVYVAQNFVRNYRLKTGFRVKGRLRIGKNEKDKGLVLDQILEIDGVKADEWEELKGFDSLTPLFPKERLMLDTGEDDLLTGRAIDLISPLGKGQRGLIVAPPRVGKTIMLKQIAGCIRKNHPQVELIMLLVDERPEEVTDIKQEVGGAVYSSTFDESSNRHIQVAELVLERAKRLVELGRDVVILLDSLTRLARGYNNLQGSKGRLLSGGVDSKALQKAGKFFSAARNAEEGGSLTLLATVLVDTGSKLDQLVFEEFKGKGNMEIHLDRNLAERRVYPAIHVVQSGTRKEDLLYHPDEIQRVHLMRRQLNALPPIEAMEVLLRNIARTKTNAELLMSGLK